MKITFCLILLVLGVGLFVYTTTRTTSGRTEAEPSKLYAPMFDDIPRWSNFQVDRIFDAADLSNIGISA